MSWYTMDSRGRVTIPAKSRVHLEAKPGSRLLLTVMDDGAVRICLAPKISGELSKKA